MKLSDAVHTDLPFVIYKKPHSGKINIIQLLKNELITDQNLLIEGFYFAPFNVQAHPVVVFPEKKSVKKSFFIREFDQNSSTNKGIKFDDTTTADSHRQKVKQALQYIRQNEIKKIIVSRKQKVHFESFDLFVSLLKLMNTYESSLVYLWHHPKIGTWMGATPELLGKYQNQQFQTVALAGTLPVDAQQPLVWKNKEIEEQQIVTDYIVNIFKNFNSDFEIGLPSTVFQGKLAHIKTDLKVRLNVDEAKILLKKLHPTPAVCGLPLKKAQNLIYKIEQYDRKYYTGFLGEIHKNKIETYVNLRCMEFFEDYFEVYAGGGIVKTSEPDKEWQETQIKTQILLSVFD